MYNNSYGTASSLSNNPFIDDPTNSRARFPDISHTPTSQSGSQSASWLPQSAVSATSAQSTGYSIQPQSSFPQYQQQQPFQVQPTGYSGHNPFQPTSAFGQQLASHVNGGGYGYPSGQNQQPQSPSYNSAQQQIYSNPGYVVQFDPYAPISQGWDGSFITGQSQNQSQHLSPTNSIGSFGASQTHTPTTTRSSSGALHPREYVRTYKTQVESWDGLTWKQLINTFETLKNAWEVRKKELDGKLGQLQQQLQYAGANYYQAQQIQQEVSRLQMLSKEAESNFDSVAASDFQMQEVYRGYRQSGDLASKRRVREATNAALQAIPDWPQPFY
ncbi:hypothetical protein AX17_002313 [Amanita inopinata Kibby_2008]|nr:hypothetical protein AX17_002313 [Amanita inopinata Kibby_2008]